MKKYDAYEQVLTGMLVDGDVDSLVIALNNVFAHGEILGDSLSVKDKEAFLELFYQGIDKMHEAVKFL